MSVIRTCPGCGVDMDTENKRPYPLPPFEGPPPHDANVEPFWCVTCGGQCPLGLKDVTMTAQVILPAPCRGGEPVVGRAMYALEAMAQNGGGQASNIVVVP